MSIDEIVNGCDRFDGLVPFVKEYLSLQVSNGSVDLKTSRKLVDYLQLVGDKASGKVRTTASLMRELVRAHPKYEHDSIVSNEIAYDLMWQLNQMST